MEAFRAIMREGTVTDAAKLLGLSQPSATELLKHTETKLGFRLFDRFKGRLRPTPEAHVLFEEVEVIFERVSRAPSRRATSSTEGSKPPRKRPAT